MQEPAPSDPTGILAIETSHPQGSVAWSPSATVQAEEELFSIGLVHGRELLPRIEMLRERVGFSRSEIGTVAVSAGPGSFTGVRIGVSAAKALAFALHRPALAVSTLEVIARNCPKDGEVAVLLDAGRNRAHGARFRREAGRVLRLTPDRTLPPAEFLDVCPAETVLIGAGVRTLSGVDRFECVDEKLDRPSASVVCAIAHDRLAAIATGEEPTPIEFRDVHQLVPFYLLRPAAEEAGERSPGERPS